MIEMQQTAEALATDERLGLILKKTCGSLPAWPSASPHLTPSPSLLAPVGDASELLEGLPGQGLAAIDGFEEEHVFLHIGCEPQEAH